MRFGSLSALDCSFIVLSFYAVAKQNLGNCVGGHGADIEPVLYSLKVEHDLFVFILFDGVVVAQFFKDPAFLLIAAFDGVDPEKGPVSATDPHHSDFYRHYIFLSVFL